MHTFEVLDSTREQRLEIMEFLEFVESYEFERVDQKTWNFSCSIKEVDDLTDLFDELGLEYHLVRDREG